MTDLHPADTVSGPPGTATAPPCYPIQLPSATALGKSGKLFLGQAPSCALIHRFQSPIHRGTTLQPSRRGSWTSSSASRFQSPIHRGTTLQLVSQGRILTIKKKVSIPYSSGHDAAAKVGTNVDPG